MRRDLRSPAGTTPGSRATRHGGRARRTGPMGADRAGPPRSPPQGPVVVRRARVPSSQVVEGMTFTTEDGVRLEGELRLPDEAPRASAVLCHPHPRHGGSKDHPILWALRNELAGTRGLAVLGFNFRGNMGSEGTYGGGRDEVRDVRAAIERVR